jgi:Na+-transporting NADH:ubiquinone oxidoreductase subunit C
VQKPDSVGGIVVFVGIIIVISSVILSGLSEGLRERKALNVQLDKKKNILSSFGVELAGKASAEEVDAEYAKVDALLVDSNGDPMEGDVATVDSASTMIEQFKDLNDDKANECAFPVYVLKDGETIVAYSVPIVGQGLWSKMLGYVSLENDLNTVRGLSFYSQGETPGLGAEIEKPWFCNNFIGKKVLGPDGAIASIVVKKGKAKDHGQGDELLHMVDGISGATITCNGVTDMFETYFKAYEPYFSKLRK